MRRFQELPLLAGRFVSEFGMEAYPHVTTIESAVSSLSQRYPGSMVMDFHNRAVDHERRVMTYVAENFGVKSDLASFAHLTQLTQADVMTWAYRSWRRDWGRPGARKCGGALVWQLDDCWPTVSWAVVDYWLVKKTRLLRHQARFEPFGRRRRQTTPRLDRRPRRPDGRDEGQ
jgi:beta-mannosidase